MKLTPLWGENLTEETDHATLQWTPEVFVFFFHWNKQFIEHNKNET